MTLTREEILNRTPGPELDALIAEHIFRWRRIKGPSFDYDGPCDSNDVLVPPTITSQEEAFRYMPPKGAIPFTYFVNRGWSKDISAAWEVVDKMRNNKIYLDVRVWPVDYQVLPHQDENNKLVDRWIVKKQSLPESICKAALLAVLNL
ncbi:BC1872 family protein [Paenibacillus sabinae]|uniref:Phage ABA sandwich domain-containing protein n=1 Tax=Paenibacillus sabinae T27 TaxID=1268072 RepID=X4ZWQ2_9BACL|nr:hypothetical protein [Paenibacillus sabinae]AHV96139.1 hypothetical protein PSAB_06015 [Paenibacillus sabinae T27]